MTFSLKEIFYSLNALEFCNKRIKIPRFPMSLSTMIYGFISLGVVLIWALTKNFMMSNLLALFKVFASFKVFKVTSLKNATFFLLIVGFFEILQEIIMIFWKSYPSVDPYYSSDFKFPLKFEISTTFTPFLTKTNAHITNLILPGMLLSYFHRYDFSKNIRIYFLMGYFSYFCGSIFWILINFIIPNSMSFFLYPLPFMIGFSSFLAYKRNENLDLWEGLFYDYEQSVANIKEEQENTEDLAGNGVSFKKQLLFEGLLDSSFESIEGEIGKISEEEKKDDFGKNQVNSKNKLLEKRKMEEKSKGLKDKIN
jgi:hypothetical protein